MSNYLSTKNFSDFSHKLCPNGHLLPVLEALHYVSCRWVRQDTLYSRHPASVSVRPPSISTPSSLTVISPKGPRGQPKLRCSPHDRPAFDEYERRWFHPWCVYAQTALLRDWEGLVLFILKSIGLVAALGSSQISQRRTNTSAFDGACFVRNKRGIFA